MELAVYMPEQLPQLGQQFSVQSEPMHRNAL